MKWLIKIIFIIAIAAFIVYRALFIVPAGSLGLIRSKIFGLGFTTLIDERFEPGFNLVWQKLLSFKYEKIFIPKDAFEISFDANINLSIIPGDRKYLTINGEITAKIEPEKIVQLERKTGFRRTKERISTDAVNHCQRILRSVPFKGNILANIKTVTKDIILILKRDYTGSGIEIKDFRFRIVNYPENINIIRQMNEAYLEKEVEAARSKGRIQREKELAIHRAKAKLEEWKIYSDFFKENPIILKYLYITELAEKAGSVNFNITDSGFDFSKPVEERAFSEIMKKKK